MIKAKARLRDGAPLYVLGLSAHHIDKIVRDGNPLTVPLDDIGGVGKIIVMYGDQQVLVRDLKRLIGPGFDVVEDDE